MAGINPADLEKAMSSLQDLAKGHNSRGTPNTKVESMTGEGGDTHVAKYKGDSDPGSWAGSSWESEEWSDDVSENGTDYNRKMGKMRKSVLSKVAKGLPLNPAEMALFKGMMEEDEGREDDGEHEDEEEDKQLIQDMMGKSGKKAKKSLGDFASEDPTVREGFEVSDFLASFADVFAKSLDALEERMTVRLAKSVGGLAVEQETFNKSLAQALYDMAAGINAQARRVESLETSPARAPKSVGNASYIEKGGYAGPQGGVTLNKSMVGEALVDMVQKGIPGVSQMDVIKFESGSSLSPALEQKVRQHLGV